MNKLFTYVLLSFLFAIQAAVAAPAFIFDSDGNRISAIGGSLNVNESGTPSGYSVLTTVRNDYTSVNVGTVSWVQLIASTSAAAKLIEIFDSSGQTLEIGTGASGFETRLFLVYPGGNGQVKLNIPASTRISIRAITATANAGEIDLNLYN